MSGKVNYQKETEKVINGLEQYGRKRLLLHSCCAPCSSYVLEYLSHYFDITLFYYNPNISPESEFKKRTEELKRLAHEMPMDFPAHAIIGEYDPREFYEAVKGLENEPEGGKRCEVCFRLRLEKAAAFAAEEGFDYFTTTLTISPLKNAEVLNRVGYEAAEKYNTVWLPSDFKKKDGYKRSIELSAEYGLYRQNYCGCIYSKRASEPSDLRSDAEK